MWSEFLRREQISARITAIPREDENVVANRGCASAPRGLES